MFVLLDNNSGSGPASLLFKSPCAIIAPSEPADVPAAIAKLEAEIRAGQHAAGYLAYELGYALEPRLARRMPARRTLPLMWFGIFDAPRTLSAADVEAFIGAEAGSAPGSLGPIVTDWDQAAYDWRFTRAHEMIAAGDIYQLNLTFKARFELAGSPLALYRDLRQRQPVAHGAYLDTGEQAILSLSPELFITRDGRRITTRPMKGTAARAASKPADRLTRSTLAADPKQRAENLMIVDLMRNDIGRLSEIGSVKVTDLFTVETFKTVHQMTSGVEAQLREGIGLRELLGALFPPGSVTGAPKIRAMELIADLEGAARGVYCGAIGYFGPGEQARFNVAIRTAVIGRDGRGEIGIGSGVVADSTGASEYAECLLKMRFLGTAEPGYDLIETLLFEAGGRGLWLLERHLARLAGSASALGFGYDEAAVRKALVGAVEDVAGEHLRVRLLLSRSGAIRCEASPFVPAAAGFRACVVLADKPVDSIDPLLRHKSTRRQRYDQDWRQAHEAMGADEVIYRNERGELTEGSRTNLFVQGRDGRLRTPPVACGLLPGVLRAELLATGAAAEAVLRVEDLRTAEAVFIGNALRGLMQAVEIAVDRQN